ncbi:MAG: NAD(P)/FAD-dependent oxidoreductase [Chloroflexota bacterium]
MTTYIYDAIIIGSGPNGLTAAIRLAQAGYRVQVIERGSTIGGGTRTLELTEAGFQHDIGSAIHPLGIASPYLKTLPLSDFGLEWVFPEYEAAHPLSDGDAVLVSRDVAKTASTLGVDEATYKFVMNYLVSNYENLLHDFLAPLRFPRAPIPFALFGMLALLPATRAARLLFREERTRAMFAGMAAHSIQALENPATGAFGWVLLTLAHAVGWGMPKGGAHSITKAMAAYFESLGGEIITDTEISHLSQVPHSRAVLFNTTPRQMLSIAWEALPPLYKRRLENYTYGAGIFKIDYALSQPVPWRNAEVGKAATVHLGGTLSEIAKSEHLITHGVHSDAPYVLFVQPTPFDPTRAPAGKHIAWAYCHVPNGSTRDMTAIMEAQIERYAPGFRDTVISKHTMTAMDVQAYNPNYMGGDINGGVQDLTQLFTRPVTRLSPYTTPNPRLFLASSSVPPGGGVHGMGGYHAAEAVLHQQKK